MHLNSSSGPKFQRLTSRLPSHDLIRGVGTVEWKGPRAQAWAAFGLGTPCAGAFSHREPQVTFLSSSRSKAGGFGCQISLFRQEGMFRGGDLPVSGLGYPRVSGPASSARTCPLRPILKAVSLEALAPRLCMTLLLVGILFPSPTGSIE